MPELPCWLIPEPPCFWLAPELPCCFAPMLEPDCEPESCACASFMPPIAGSAATGAATAKAAAAPKTTASIRIFILLRRASPGDNPLAKLRLRRPQKILDERMFIFPPAHRRERSCSSASWMECTQRVLI